MTKTTKKIVREMTEEQAKAFDYANSSEAFHDGLKKEKAKGSRFVQIDTKALMKMAGTFTNRTQFQLFNYFIDKMGSQSNALMVSQGVMAGIFGVSIRTVQRAIERLEELQYIQVIKVQGGNCYVINSEVAWKTGRDKKDYAIFSATVVAEWDEQRPENYERWQKELRPISQRYIEAEMSEDGDVKVTKVEDNNERCEDTTDMFEVDNFVKND